MGVRGELFTTEISLDNRTYFFNVKENRTGDVFLQVVESKNTEGAGFDRHAIVVFEDDMQKFLQGLENTLKFIEKNRKTKLKEAAERGEAPRRKIVRRAPAQRDASSTGPRQSSPEGKPRAAKAPAKRVKVISKKDMKKD
jgi:hypothetical protein